MCLTNFPSVSLVPVVIHVGEILANREGKATHKVLYKDFDHSQNSQKVLDNTKRLFRIKMKWNKTPQHLKKHEAASPHCALVPPYGVAQILLKICMGCAQSLHICSDVILVLGHQGGHVAPPRPHHIWPELRWLDFLLTIVAWLI